MKTHTTRDGRKIKLCDMTDAHLEATISLIERRAENGLIVRYGGGSCAEDMWYDEDNLQGKDALDYLDYDEYIAERNKRKTLTLAIAGRTQRQQGSAMRYLYGAGTL